MIRSPPRCNFKMIVRQRFGVLAIQMKHALFKSIKKEKKFQFHLLTDVHLIAVGPTQFCASFFDIFAMTQASTLVVTKTFHYFFFFCIYFSVYFLMFLGTSEENAMFFSHFL